MGDIQEPTAKLGAARVDVSARDFLAMAAAERRNDLRSGEAAASASEATGQQQQQQERSVAQADFKAAALESYRVKIVRFYRLLTLVLKGEAARLAIRHSGNGAALWAALRARYGTQTVAEFHKLKQAYGAMQQGRDQGQTS